MDKLILKNGKEISLEAGASLSSLKSRTSSIEEMAGIFAEFTEENLSEVTVQNSEGLTIGTYKDLKFVSETSVIDSDGTVVTSYNVRGKTEEEKRLDALEKAQEQLAENQEVQGEAIADLGAVTSTLAEAQ